jgi:hypothetical protein
VLALYERYEDKVDEFAERGMTEMNKYYKVLVAGRKIEVLKVLS